MPPQVNPFAALTLIAAPAVLTNACSVMTLSTGNRLARAVDRARELTNQLARPEVRAAADAPMKARELHGAQERMLLLIRALRAIYIALGGFAAAAMLSLIGAIVTPSAPEAVGLLLEAAAVIVGGIAVGGVIRASLLLTRETRIAVLGLEERAEHVQAEFQAWQRAAQQEGRPSAPD